METYYWEEDLPSLQCPDRCPEPLGAPPQCRLWCDWIPVHHSQGQRDILISPHRCPLGIPNLHGWHQTRCRGPASSEMQACLVRDDGSARASIESLINIESLFSLLSISLIFRFDFSLTIELTWNSGVRSSVDSGFWKMSRLCSQWTEARRGLAWGGPCMGETSAQCLSLRLITTDHHHLLTSTNMYFFSTLPNCQDRENAILYDRVTTTPWLILETCLFGL